MPKTTECDKYIQWQETWAKGHLGGGNDER